MEDRPHFAQTTVADVVSPAAPEEGKKPGMDITVGRSEPRTGLNSHSKALCSRHICDE